MTLETLKRLERETNRLKAEPTILNIRKNLKFCQIPKKLIFSSYKSHMFLFHSRMKNIDQTRYLDHNLEINQIIR